MMQFRLTLFTVFACLLMAGVARSEIVTRTIGYEQDGVALEGYLAYDDAIAVPEGGLPGVLVIHEWWGLNDYAKSRARQLAELGYVAFALDMYGKGKVTTDPKQAGAWSGMYKGTPLGRERAKAGLAVLMNQPNVDKSRIAAIGYCFGGSMVLELAYSGAPVKGVVSFHGGLLPPNEDDNHITAKVLICHGAADHFESDRDIKACQDGLTDKGVDWQMIYYHDAVHSFTNPDAGKAGIPGVAYNKQADQRSWRHMRMFFDELFND